MAGGTDEPLVRRGIVGAVNAACVRTELRIVQCRNQSVIGQWPDDAAMLNTPDQANSSPRERQRDEASRRRAPR